MQTALLPFQSNYCLSDNGWPERLGRPPVAAPASCSHGQDCVEGTHERQFAGPGNALHSLLLVVTSLAWITS